VSLGLLLVIWVAVVFCAALLINRYFRRRGSRRVAAARSAHTPLKSFTGNVRWTTGVYSTPPRYTLEMYDWGIRFRPVPPLSLLFPTVEVTYHEVDEVQAVIYRSDPGIRLFSSVLSGPILFLRHDSLTLLEAISTRGVTTTTEPKVLNRWSLD